MGPGAREVGDKEAAPGREGPKKISRDVQGLWQGVSGRHWGWGYQGFIKAAESHDVNVLFLKDFNSISWRKEISLMILSLSGSLCFPGRGA